ncbi:F-box domain-containing protein [Mycena kentingensis (nom. inval.)]|nr:F-box domain-containing protein [Mycena kentingensis (nom. inval.)]
MDLLSLPPELLVECLSHLRYRDLEACLQTYHHALCDIILASPLLLYRAELDRAGVEENPRLLTHLSIEERRAALREREENWMFLKRTSVHAAAFDFHATRSIYWVSGDYWIIGDAPDPALTRSNAVKMLRTAPGADGAMGSWRTASAEGRRRVIDFVAAPEELDLVGLITYSASTEQPGMDSLDVHLLSFSTLQPHPRAAIPVVHIHMLSPHDGVPSVTVDVTGRVLAFALFYRQAEQSVFDGLYVYDWHTGLRVCEPKYIAAWSPVGLSFLTPTLTLTPPTDNAVSLSPPEHIASLLLPRLRADIRATSFQFRALPNPPASASANTSERLARSHSRFLPLASRALLQCAFETENGGGEAPPTLHLFVLRRAALLPLLARILSTRSFPREVPWRVWGPQTTRFVDVEADGGMGMHPCTTLAGERLVSVCGGGADFPGLVGTAPRLRVRNFGEGAVRTARRRITQLGTGSGYLETETAYVRVVEAEEPLSPAEEDTITLAHELPSSPVSPASAPASSRRPSFLAFENAAEVYSTLPYVESISRASCTYDAVEIGFESVVGVEFGASLAVRSAEVVRFG